MAARMAGDVMAKNISSKADRKTAINKMAAAKVAYGGRGGFENRNARGGMAAASAAWHNRKTMTSGGDRRSASLDTLTHAFPVTLLFNRILPFRTAPEEDSGISYRPIRGCVVRRMARSLKRR